MVNMLRYIALVAYLTGVLGQFSSNYTCEDIAKAITEPVTLDQIAGTWYEVAWAWVSVVVLAHWKCAKYTITNEKGADGKMKPQQKYTTIFGGYDDDGWKWETTVKQDTTVVGRFEVVEYLPFWLVKTGVDFTKPALRLQCQDKSTNISDEKSDEMDSELDGLRRYYELLNNKELYISILSRTKTLSDEENKIIKEKLKTITDLGNAEFQMCSPLVSATTDATAAVDAKSAEATTASTVSASSTSDAAVLGN